MVNSNDGFEIAEKDLEIRGPGDIEGTQQSGQMFDLKIAKLGTDGNILQESKKIAEEIINKDKFLSSEENKILKNNISKFTNNVSWRKIS